MADSSGAQTTSLSRSWRLKTAAFMIAALAIGIWGLADAAIFYPKAGEAYASLKLKDYLERAKDAGRLSQAKVAEPRKDLAELRSRRAELENKKGSTGPDGRLALMELAKLDWLESLAVIWRLDSAKDRIEAPPDAQLAALEGKWKTTATPKPLSRLDLLIQWIITGLGLAAACVVGANWVRAAGRRYEWDASQKRLSVPGGGTFGPQDVREFDKRKWHKFFVTVVLKDGEQHKMDLLRYAPLEEWVLEMERIAFPEQAAENGESRAESSNQEHATDSARAARDAGDSTAG